MWPASMRSTNSRLTDARTRKHTRAPPARRDQRDGWDIRTKSELTTTCDAEYFYLKGEITAFEGDDQVFERRWDVKIQREVF